MNPSMPIKKLYFENVIFKKINNLFIRHLSNSEK